MTFLSPSFACFLIVVLVTYEILPQRFKKVFLLFTSCAFYATNSVPYLFLLLFSSLLFYRLAIQIEISESSHKPILLWLGILVQLIILISFKFISALQNKKTIDFLIPLGISYYSFKLISYLTDVYLGKAPAERDPVAFTNYVTFFPQIVSGPIQKSAPFLLQITNSLGTNPEMVSSGLRLILCGLFKKLVVADVLSFHIEHFMGRSPSHVGLAGFLSTYFIPIQVYADFSGITDIAIGLGKLFGIESPGNFAMPFYAPNIQEFWRRWHMTLTSWIREYVFMPLSISFRNWGTFGLVLSISVTMMLVGIWHGFTLNWIAFGLMHALYFTVSVVTLPMRNKFFSKHSFLDSTRGIAGPVITFHLVLLSFTLFKAATWNDFTYILTNFKEQSMMIYKHIRSLESLKYLIFESGFNINPRELFRITFSVGIMEGIHFLQNNSRLRSLFFSSPARFRWFSYVFILIAIILFGNYGNLRFIYAIF